MQLPWRHEAARAASTASICPLIMTVCRDVTFLPCLRAPCYVARYIFTPPIHLSFSLPSSSFSGLILPPTGTIHFFIYLMLFKFFTLQHNKQLLNIAFNMQPCL